MISNLIKREIKGINLTCNFTFIYCKIQTILSLFCFLHKSTPSCQTQKPRQVWRELSYWFLIGSKISRSVKSFITFSIHFDDFDHIHELRSLWYLNFRTFCFAKIDPFDSWFLPKLAQFCKQNSRFFRFLSSLRSQFCINCTNKFTKWKTFFWCVIFYCRSYRFKRRQWWPQPLLQVQWKWRWFAWRSQMESEDRWHAYGCASGSDPKSWNLHRKEFYGWWSSRFWLASWRVDSCIRRSTFCTHHTSSCTSFCKDNPGRRDQDQRLP